MNNLLLWIVALAAARQWPRCQAQNIAGDWQGGANWGGPGGPRIVIKISLEDDSLKAVMYQGRALPPARSLETVRM